MYFPLEYVNCLVPCLIFVTDNATTRTSVVLNKTLTPCAIDHLESSKRKEGEGKKQEKETNQPRKVVQNTLNIVQTNQHYEAKVLAGVFVTQ